MAAGTRAAGSSLCFVCPSDVALGRPAMVQECVFSAPGSASSPNLSLNPLLPSLVFQATTKPLRHHHSRLRPAPKPLHPGVRDEVPRPVRVLRAAVLVGQSHRCTARTKGPLGERLLTLRGAASSCRRGGDTDAKATPRFVGTTNPSPVLYFVTLCLRSHVLQRLVAQEAGGTAAWGGGWLL